MGNKFYTKMFKKGDTLGMISTCFILELLEIWTSKFQRHLLRGKVHCMVLLILDSHGKTGFVISAGARSENMCFIEVLIIKLDITDNNVVECSSDKCSMLFIYQRLSSVSG